MIDDTSKTAAVSRDSVSSTRVEGRTIVSAPSKTIQVERVSISAQQKSSLAAAIRAGKAAVGKSEKSG